MSLNDFNALIKELGNTMGLNSIQHESGYCRIEVDNGLIFNFQYQEARDSLYLFCEVGNIPQTGAETYCQKLLAANLAGAQSGCGMFALEQESMTVLLTLEIPLAAISASCFRKRLDGMALHAERHQAMFFKETPADSLSCCIAEAE